MTSDPSDTERANNLALHRAFSNARLNVEGRQYANWRSILDDFVLPDYRESNSREAVFMITHMQAPIGPKLRKLKNGQHIYNVLQKLRAAGFAATRKVNTGLHIMVNQIHIHNGQVTNRSERQESEDRSGLGLGLAPARQECI